MLVDVVIVTKDRPDLLRKQVLQIREKIPFRKIVVVDTSKVLDKSFYEGLGVEVLHVPESKLGFARQRGLEACDSEFVFGIDDDIVLTKNCYNILFDFLNNSPEDVFAVSGRVIYGYKGDAVLEKIFKAGRPKRFTHSAGLVLMKREVLLSAGGYSVRTHWGEDAELAYRLERQGLYWCLCDCEGYHYATFLGMIKRYWHNGQMMAWIGTKSMLWCFSRFFGKSFVMPFYYCFRTREPRALVYYCLLNLASLFGYGRELKKNG
jgi:glycosyltransferase involved in cell wall biosynthesis